MDWSSEIENDGETRTLIEGQAKFIVIGLEKKYTRNRDLMADLTINIESKQGMNEVHDNLVLSKKSEWKLCQFFTAIGQRKHGERILPDWNAVRGSTGECEVFIEEYLRNDGTKGKSNKIKKYLDPNEPIKNPAVTSGLMTEDETTGGPLNYSDEKDKEQLINRDEFTRSKPIGPGFPG